MIGWELKPKFFHDEINSGYSGKIHAFWGFCLKFICPVVMFFILLAQVDGIIGCSSALQDRDDLSPERRNDKR